MTESPDQPASQTSADTKTGRETAPELAWDVTRYQIIIARLWVESVHLASTEDAPDAIPGQAPDVSGRAGQSRDESFMAYVDWTLRVATPRPFRAHGTLAMEFAHKPGLQSEAVEYYSQVNAPILAYPYIRQLVVQLTCGRESGPVVVKPLDVPRFVANAKGRWASQYLEKLRSRTPGSSGKTDGATGDNGA